MGMYHITSQAEIQALINAKDRLGAENVTVLLDGSTINANNGNNGYAKVYQQLVAAGVNVVKSSPAFSITHEKDLIVDAGTPTAKAILSSVNLTNMSATTRDYGIITSDPGIIQEWTSVFNADLENAKNGTANTPPLSNPNLVFSPVDAEQKLVDIINSAADSRYSVTATSESLTNKAVVAALQAAAARGVNVQLIVPEYIEGSPSGAVINYPALRQLNATPIAGTNQTIQARVMPYPATVEHPYMHGKMLLVSGPDGDLGYIGSVNLSTNSLEKARECGFVFNDQTAPQAVQLLKNDFASDWQVSIPPPTNPTPPAEG
jgi:phosphatidylserine/phosphatidylglycerophosphate/cardiolipin synthase-like enzyme